MFRIKYGVALIALAYAGVALADDVPEFNGTDLVVTASGIPQSQGVAPVSVTVVTARDIANSPATNVAEVLATVAGVHVFGIGNTSPTVDLRGFGMTGVSNTLILVDGVRQNSDDMSAPDLSYIPLSSIERIEIVRGSGAVQYGDGASGGVVNIITRAGYREHNSLTLTQTVGSFDLRQSDANFNLAGDRVSLDGFAESMNTDHYRDNSAERKDGGGLAVNWKLDQGSARLYARTSSDSQGLPGARRVDPAAGTNLYDSDPSGAATPQDHGYQKTDVLGFQANNQLGAGRLYIDLSTRDKTTITDFISQNDTDQRKLNEDAGSVRYVLPFAAANQWMLGYDFLSSDVSTGDDEYQMLPGVENISGSKQRHQGVFTEVQTDLWSGARLSVGGRDQRIDDQLSCNGLTQGVSGCSSFSNDRELHAWQIGLRQALDAQWSVYAKQGQSFRLPNADEVQSVSAPLLPQQSHDSEIGLEWSQNQARLRAALFRSDVSNEIHYLPYAYNAYYQADYGANVNLSPTRHQGLELEGQLPLSRTVSMNANLTWQQATFRSGTTNGVNLAGNNIPMVPSLMGNLGVSWEASDRATANVALNYVGKQRLDNDQTNTFGAELGAETLVDAKLTYQFCKSVSGTLAVENLFNRTYATYGVASTSTAAYNLYPGDPRNYRASLSMTF